MSRPHWKPRTPPKFAENTLLVAKGLHYRVMGTPDKFVLGHGYAPAYVLQEMKLDDYLKCPYNGPRLVLAQNMVEAGQFQLFEG
jgi:hypothetical protein